MFLNVILIIAVVVIAVMLVLRLIKKNQDAKVEEQVVVDDKTYTLDMMINFVKREWMK